MTTDVGMFLEELTALSKKHGVWIGGCGCCGSPYLGDLLRPIEGKGYSNLRSSERFNYTGLDIDEAGNYKLAQI